MIHVTLYMRITTICLSFTLSFGPLQAQNFTSSNLPIIVLETAGQRIVDDPKITVHMGIISNGPGNRNALTDPFNNYDGLIGIEIHGNITQIFEKKSYVLETRDQVGQDLKVSLLGMPKESDWVLSASYLDKTFIRDPLAFYMSRSAGRWTSRTIHCELVINGIYLGIYVLNEKIKRDKNRVDIAKLLVTDNSGDPVTGGYIYELAQDGPGFGERRRFVYPKADDITVQQTAYIEQYDNDFRQVMEGPGFADPVQGYAAWIDVDSFVDEVLLQEACKNSDAYGWSSYFHKDRLGKLNAGPVWDFDQSLSNSTFNDGPNYQEWIILKDNGAYPLFWKTLFTEAGFQNQLSQRWMELRTGAFKTDRLMTFIDSVANVLDEAQERNFEKWKILGTELWRSTPGALERVTYQMEVDYLKSFLTNRLAWMDENLNSVTATEKEDHDIFHLQNYPNPVSQHTTISYDIMKAGFVTLTVYDLVGRKIETLVQEEQSAKNYQVPFRIQNLPNGVYIYTLQLDSCLVGIKKMVITK